MAAEPPSLAWRRFLRFSVRRMVVIVLMVGVCLGLGVRIVRVARIQPEAVAAIAKARGTVIYDWQTNNSSPGRVRKPPWPGWLVNLVGAEYFGNVVSVVLPSASEDDLIHVGQLRRLRTFQIDKPDMTDAGLAHLRGLTNLSKLDLAGTRVTDAGLVNVKELINLFVFDLSDTNVSDAGLAHLKGMTNLSWLRMNRTHVGDPGLAHLKHMTELYYLGLQKTQVTDAGLAHGEHADQTPFARSRRYECH